MISLQHQPLPDSERKPYAEAVSRLAGIRHALRLVDELGEGPSPDPENDGLIADCFAAASPARQAVFDRKSAMAVNAAAAGLEALLAVRHDGQEPHAEANRALVEQIRRELEEVSQLVLR